MIHLSSYSDRACANWQVNHVIFNDYNYTPLGCNSLLPIENKNLKSWKTITGSGTIRVRYNGTIKGVSTINLHSQGRGGNTR